MDADPAGPLKRSPYRDVADHAAAVWPRSPRCRSSSRQPSRAEYSSSLGGRGNFEGRVMPGEPYSGCSTDANCSRKSAASSSRYHCSGRSPSRSKAGVGCKSSSSPRAHSGRSCSASKSACLEDGRGNDQVDRLSHSKGGEGNEERERLASRSRSEGTVRILPDEVQGRSTKSPKALRRSRDQDTGRSQLPGGSHNNEEPQRRRSGEHSSPHYAGAGGEHRHIRRSEALHNGDANGSSRHGARKGHDGGRSHDGRRISRSLARRSKEERPRDGRSGATGEKTGHAGCRRKSKSGGRRRDAARKEMPGREHLADDAVRHADARRRSKSRENRDDNRRPASPRPRDGSHRLQEFSGRRLGARKSEGPEKKHRSRSRGYDASSRKGKENSSVRSESRGPKGKTHSSFRACLRSAPRSVRKDASRRQEELDGKRPKSRHSRHGRKRRPSIGGDKEKDATAPLRGKKKATLRPPWAGLTAPLGKKATSKLDRLESEQDRLRIKAELEGELRKSLAELEERRRRAGLRRGAGHDRERKLRSPSRIAHQCLRRRHGSQRRASPRLEAEAEGKSHRRRGSPQQQESVDEVEPGGFKAMLAQIAAKRKAELLKQVTAGANSKRSRQDLSPARKAVKGVLDDFIAPPSVDGQVKRHAETGRNISSNKVSENKMRAAHRSSSVDGQTQAEVLANKSQHDELLAKAERCIRDAEARGLFIRRAQEVVENGKTSSGEEVEETEEKPNDAGSYTYEEGADEVENGEEEKDGEGQEDRAASEEDNVNSLASENAAGSADPSGSAAASEQNRAALGEDPGVDAKGVREEVVLDSDGEGVDAYSYSKSGDDANAAPSSSGARTPLPLTRERRLAAAFIDPSIGSPGAVDPQDEVTRPKCPSGALEKTSPPLATETLLSQAILKCQKDSGTLPVPTQSLSAGGQSALRSFRTLPHEVIMSEDKKHDLSGSPPCRKRADWRNPHRRHLFQRGDGEDIATQVGAGEGKTETGPTNAEQACLEEPADTIAQESPSPAPTSPTGKETALTIERHAPGSASVGSSSRSLSATRKDLSPDRKTHSRSSDAQAAVPDRDSLAERLRQLAGSRVSHAEKRSRAVQSPSRFRRRSNSLEVASARAEITSRAADGRTRAKHDSSSRSSSSRSCRKSASGHHRRRRKKHRRRRHEGGLASASAPPPGPSWPPPVWTAVPPAMANAPIPTAAWQPAGRNPMWTQPPPPGYPPPPVWPAAPLGLGQVVWPAPGPPGPVVPGAAWSASWGGGRPGG